MAIAAERQGTGVWSRLGAGLVLRHHRLRHERERRFREDLERVRAAGDGGGWWRMPSRSDQPWVEKQPT